MAPCAWSLVPRASCPVLGAWYLVPGASCLVRGACNANATANLTADSTASATDFPTIFVVGDSHVDNWLNAVRLAAHGRAVIVPWASLCGYLPQSLVGSAGIFLDISTCPEELRARIAKLGTQLTDSSSVRHAPQNTFWVVHNAEILERCAAVWKNC